MGIRVRVGAGIVRWGSLPPRGRFREPRKPSSVSSRHFDERSETAYLTGPFSDAVLRRVRVQTREFEKYQGILPDPLLREAREAAAALRDRRVLHISSTAVGGGVAELLHSEVPLLRELGVDTEWDVVQGTPEFFAVTKQIHNGLQGGPLAVSDEEWHLYEDFNQHLSDHVRPDEWDVIVVHDPQPCALLPFLSDRGRARWVWRVHIDSSRAGSGYVRRFDAYARPYDAAVFSNEVYALPGLRPAVTIIWPAIDPFSPKNEPMEAAEAQRIVEAFGVPGDAPLVTQVSRFDPWKDPLGVIESWALARVQVPELQLALVGQGADDDPEGAVVLAQVQAAARGMKGLHLIANRATDRDVNAFQTASRAAVQKSLREGFGLTVAEASWAGTPVIGSRVGGIPLQIEHGVTGFLVENVKECETAMVQVVRDPERAHAMGRAAHERVRRDFLLPRMLRDDCRLWARLVRQPAARAAPHGSRILQGQPTRPE